MGTFESQSVTLSRNSLSLLKLARHTDFSDPGLHDLLRLGKACLGGRVLALPRIEQYAASISAQVQAPKRLLPSGDFGGDLHSSHGQIQPFWEATNPLPAA